MENYFVGCFIGALLTLMGCAIIGTSIHEQFAAYAACEKHNGVITRSSLAVLCNDGTSWHWKEGYIVRFDR